MRRDTFADNLGYWEANIKAAKKQANENMIRDDN